MNKSKITVGVDIGGTNTVFGFIKENGNYLFSNSIPTQAHEDVHTFITRLAHEIKNSFKQYADNYILTGIGIAAPSANNFQGTIDTPSNIKWGKVNFVTLIKKYFQIPIAITNDANAAALGEYEFGLGKGLKNFIVITLGTGLGSGIIISGNLLYSEGGLAGEFGHTIVKPNGRLCNCHRRGCLETYASANGICRTVLDLIARYNEPSELQNIPFTQMTGEIINDLALKGDHIAVKAFQYTGKILGKALANLATSFVPEAIILFGGLSGSGELLLKPTRFHFEKNLLNIHKGKVKIFKSSIENGMAAVLGASSLVNKKINNHVMGININNNIEKNN
ncbi:MAG: glucokinase [Ignavibacteria bacterium RBG_16_34_14]|nr:MAG: glucokinase [Ignavibacteria bacterium RBG_16_34_14]